ncbi:MAG: MFS transporter, partial [Micromonosporaceae bacterium]
MARLPRFTRRGSDAGRTGPARPGEGAGLRAVAPGLKRLLQRVREHSAKGEIGMIRLLDLHAISCAGDTLVAIGLAGTIFFSVPVGEARVRVALYLLVTMAPFALLAPVVGPMLDHFRHGRRYALAVTMLGRAFLAWVIADNLDNIALYPAAFGMLVLSRSYGVARSAAVPRLLPPNLGLVEAGARASLYGTVAGAVIAPVGAALFYLGPQWTLRLSTVVFAIGMVIALRLPPRADSDPPETVPRILQVLGRKTAKALTGQLLLVALSGSAGLRAAYGFLALFLAFRVREGDFSIDEGLSIGLITGGLGAGSLIATALCAKLQIRRPLLLQGLSLIVVVLVAVVAAWWYVIPALVALCLAAALASGISKLALDAVIQERTPEKLRATAFARSETILILAWVAGGGVGLIPLSGQVGLVTLTAGLALGAAQVCAWASRLRHDRLHGFAQHDPPDQETTQTYGQEPTQRLSSPHDEPTEQHPRTGAEPTQRLSDAEPTQDLAGAEPTQQLSPGDDAPTQRRPGGDQPTQQSPGADPGDEPTDQLPRPRSDEPPERPRGPSHTGKASPAPPPGYHLYRPSGHRARR